MYRKKHYGRPTITLNKQNCDYVVMENVARQKLNTFSEDPPAVLHHDKHQQEFTGWADDNILIERVNKTQKSWRSPRVESKNIDDPIMRIFSNRKALDSKRRILQVSNEQSICNDNNDFKTGIYILKKQAEYLESQSATVDPTTDKSKFPRHEDLITTPKRIQPIQCYPTHNNFFNSREKYSEREINRKRIKNLRNLSLKYPHNYSSLLMSPNYCKMLLQDTLANRSRPSSSVADGQGNRCNGSNLQTKHHSHRVHSEKADSCNSSNTISESESNRARCIPSSFKKCRMNKRNRSARSHMVDPTELQLFGQTTEIKSGVSKGRAPHQGGPLDDLIQIRFPEFF